MPPTTKEKQSTNPVSRRDFLKTFSLLAGGLLWTKLFSSYRNFFSYPPTLGKNGFRRRLFERERTEEKKEWDDFAKKHGITTINASGRVISLEDSSALLKPEANMFLDILFKRMMDIETSGKPNNPDGYADIDQVDWKKYSLDFDRTVIFIDMTDKGEMIGEVSIKRKSESGFGDPQGPFGWAIGESLFVLKKNPINGDREQAVWFDNKESYNTESGQHAKIVVNKKEGKVLQVFTDKDLFPIGKYPIKEKIEVRRVDWETGQLKQVIIPGSPKFAACVQNLLGPYKKWISELDNDKRTAFFGSLYEKMFSENQDDIDHLIKIFDSICREYGLPIFKKGKENSGIISKVLRLMAKESEFSTPFGIKTELNLFEAMKFMEMIFNGGLTGELVEQLDRDPDLYNMALVTSFSAENKQVAPFISEMAKKEVKLPLGMPEIAMVRMRLNPTYADTGNKAWALIATHPSGRIETLKVIFPSVLIPNKDGGINVARKIFGIQEKDWKEFLKKFSPKPLPENMKKMIDFGPTDINETLLGWSADDGANGFWELNQDELRMFWDGEAGRIYPGLIVENKRDGTKTGVEIRGNFFGGDGITNRKFINPRRSLFNGDSPYTLIDVTERYLELIKRGYDTVSPINLMPARDALQIILGWKDYSNFASLSDFFNKNGELNLSLPRLDEFGLESLKTGSLVVTRNNKDGGYLCTRYVKKTRKFLGIPIGSYFVEAERRLIPGNVLLGAIRIRKINGENVVIVSETQNKEVFYALPTDGVMFIGSKSNLSITLQIGAEIGAILFAGYELSEIEIVSDLFKFIFSKLTGSIAGVAN